VLFRSATTKFVRSQRRVTHVQQRSSHSVL
jgi:hypothetical protein